MAPKPVLAAVFLVTLGLNGRCSASFSHLSAAPAGAAHVPALLELRLPQPQPFPLTPQGVRTAMQRWIAAYNTHDVRTVLAYLTDQRLRYFDCDYASNHGYSLTSRGAVQAWLRQRWARGDHIQLRHVILGDSGRQPSDPITSIGLEVHRTSRATPRGMDTLFKLLPLHLPGTRGLIQIAALAGNTQCPLFKVD